LGKSEGAEEVVAVDTEAAEEAGALAAAEAVEAAVVEAEAS
jgi:hypothetical protein